MNTPRPGDEMFVWFNKRYNVSHIKQWLETHPQPIQYVATRKYAEFMLGMSPANMEPAGLMISVDWDKVKVLPVEALEEPILGVHTQHGVLFVDGNHRIGKAYQTGKLGNNAIIITETQAAAAERFFASKRMTFRKAPQTSLEGTQ